MLGLQDRVRFDALKEDVSFLLWWQFLDNRWLVYRRYGLSEVAILHISVKTLDMFLLDYG